MGSVHGFRLTPSVLRFIIGGYQIHTAKEVNLADDMQFKTVRVAYTGCWAINNHSGRCPEVEFFLRADALGKGARLAGFLEILGNGDFFTSFSE